MCMLVEARRPHNGAGRAPCHDKLMTSTAGRPGCVCGRSALTYGKLMNKIKLKNVCRLLLLGLPALAISAAAGETTEPDAALSAGTFTIMRADRSAFTEPAPVLTMKQRQLFMVGRNVFHRKWAAVVSLNGDWGLGPTFNASQCSECHVEDGRGSPPQRADEQLLSLLVRISIPGSDEHGGPKPHPNYGDQIQNRALQGQSVDFAYSHEPIPQEADLYMDWEDEVVAFADGEQVTLRKPKLRIEHLNFGPLGPEVMTSLRLAQPIFGLGLLDAVPEETLQAAGAPATGAGPQRACQHGVGCDQPADGCSGATAGRPISRASNSRSRRPRSAISASRRTCIPIRTVRRFRRFAAGSCRATCRRSSTTSSMRSSFGCAGWPCRRAET